MGNGIENKIIYKICRICMPINTNASQLGFTTTHESKKENTFEISSSRSRDNDGSLWLYQKVLHEGIESGIEPRMTCRFIYNRFMNHCFGHILSPLVVSGKLTLALFRSLFLHVRFQIYAYSFSHIYFLDLVMDGINRSFETVTSYDTQTLQVIYIIYLDFDVCFMVSNSNISFPYFKYSSSYKLTVNYF